MTTAEKKKLDQDFASNLKAARNAWRQGDRHLAESSAYNLCCIARDPADWLAQYPVGG